MKFTKGSFYIQQIPEAENKFELRSGWISGDYGFYKSGKIWSATDIASGMLIYRATTRRECVEFIENNVDKIEKAKTQEKYIAAINDMLKFLGGDN